MKKIILLLTLGTFCFCAACQSTEDVSDHSSETEKIVEADTVPETEKIVEPDTSFGSELSLDTEIVSNVVVPLPTTIDMNQLDNCTVAVSLEEGDAYVDDTGAMQMKVTVYTYDLYDMVDIATLAEGGSIRLNGQDVLINSIERDDNGYVSINGGLDNGGYELQHQNSGVYYEIGYSDVKSYYAIGEATLRVSPDFVFVDSSDLDKGDVTYYPSDFLTTDAGIVYYFSPDNTTITIQDGYIIAMNRIYTP